MIATIVAFLANSLTITVLLAYLFALWAAIVAWTWFDISTRTDNILYKLGAILIVATGAIFGFAIYLLLRPAYTQEEARMRKLEEVLLVSQSGFLSCPSCHFAVREDFAYCPNCSFKLHSKCSSCSREIDVSWNSCPYCGGEQKAPFEPKPVEVVPQMPAAAEPAMATKGRNFALFSTLASFLKPRNVKRRSKPAKARGTTFGKTKKGSRAAKRKKA
jgi:hypothetical protein